MLYRCTLWESSFSLEGAHDGGVAEAEQKGRPTVHLTRGPVLQHDGPEPAFSCYARGRWKVASNELSLVGTRDTIRCLN